MGLLDKLGGYSKSFDEKIAGQTEAQEADKSSGQPQADSESQQEKSADNFQDTEAQNTEQQTGQPQQEQQEEKQQQTPQERKLAGKFENREALIDGLNELGSKLDLGTIDSREVQKKSNKELEREYKALEKELGETSDIDKTRQQNQQLKQQVNNMRQQLQRNRQIMRRLQQQRNQQTNQQQSPAPQQGNAGQPAQQGSQQPRDPQTGQFLSGNQTSGQSQGQTSQQQAQQSVEGQETADIDTDKWLKKYYSNKNQTIKEIAGLPQAKRNKLMEKMAPHQQREIQQKVNQDSVNQQAQQQQNNQVQSQQQAQQQQQQQQAQQPDANQYKQKERQLFSRAVKQFKNNMGEELDKETEKEMVKVLKSNPLYRRQTLFPDGRNLQYAYNMAKRRTGNVEEQKQSPEVDERNVQTREDLEAQKESAKINSNTRRNIPNNQSDDNIEQRIKDSIFKNSGGGLFG